MNDLKSALIVFVLSSLPYAVVSWAYMSLTDGGSTEFWQAYGFLVVARLFFGVIEGLGGVFAWRIYNKGQVVKGFVDLLKNNSYPQRFYQHDDALAYLCRIEDNEEYSAELRNSVRELIITLRLAETSGIVAGGRMYDAFESALEGYSPKAKAPHLQG